eukprot:8342288-Pyramimonas_sp.AAC.1
MSSRLSSCSPANSRGVSKMGASVLDPGSSPSFAGGVELPPWPCPRLGTKRTARRAALVQLRLAHLVVIRPLALHDGE